MLLKANKLLAFNIPAFYFIHSHSTEYFSCLRADFSFAGGGGGEGERKYGLQVGMFFYFSTSYCLNYLISVSFVDIRNRSFLVK